MNRNSRMCAMFAGAAISLTAFGVSADDFTPLRRGAELTAKENSPQTRSEKLLHTSVRIEINCVEGFLGTIRSALRASNVRMSDKSKRDYDAAKKLYGAAKKLDKKGDHRKAYGTIRKAYGALRPAVDEVLRFNHAPQKVKRSVGKSVDLTAKRVDALAEILKGRTTADARRLYQEAKALHKEGKALWQSGKNRDAMIKLDTALSTLDKAIQANWPNKTAR